MIRIEDWKEGENNGLWYKLLLMEKMSRIKIQTDTLKEGLIEKPFLIQCGPKHS